jgi:hypothetical protein
LKWHKNLLCRGIIISCICLIASNVFCDEFQSPFPCYPREIQKRFAQHGRKLDLDGNNRIKDSWGLLANRGSEFWIYTYYPATDEDFMIMTKIIMENMRGLLDPKE